MNDRRFDFKFEISDFKSEYRIRLIDLLSFLHGLRNGKGARNKAVITKF